MPIVALADDSHAAIVWRCDLCGDPIADGCGYLTLSYAQLHEHERAVKAWDERIAAKYPGPLRCYPMSELADFPGPVVWGVLHRGCDPEPERSDYWIAVERIRTAGEVISWSAHLLGKRWVQSTTWADVLRGVSGQLGSRGRTRP
jgi:hypothetical protein